MAAEDQLDVEIAAFEKQQGELEVEHKGKWVVFCKGEPHGFYDTFGEADDDAVKQFGDEPFLIREIGAVPHTLPNSLLPYAAP